MITDAEGMLGSPMPADMKFALDTLFNHPNVGPFIARQLIQRFVTSNPSRGYVYRVASVFNDNGKKKRGDLKATIRAVLLDPEARNPNFISHISHGATYSFTIAGQEISGANTNPDLNVDGVSDTFTMPDLGSKEALH